MYLLLGKTNCSRCDMVKNILANKKIEFDYKLLEDLDEDNKKYYLNLARKSNQMEFPIIIKNNDTIVNFREVV